MSALTVQRQVRATHTHTTCETVYKQNRVPLNTSVPEDVDWVAFVVLFIVLLCYHVIYLSIYSAFEDALYYGRWNARLLYMWSQQEEDATFCTSLLLPSKLYAILFSFFDLPNRTLKVFLLTRSSNVSLWFVLSVRLTYLLKAFWLSI